MEEWVEIRKDYFISSLGRIKNKYDKFMTPYKLKRGYYRITLHIDKKPRGFLIHRLVAEAFIPNINNFPEVNHKDEDKFNNIVSNLEWCTSEYNINYGNRTTKTKKPILQYDLEGNFVREWDSIISLHKAGYTKSSIWKCCKGKINNYKKFNWEYKNDRTKKAIFMA